MGDRGWVSIRYKGVYYTLYSHWALLEELGEWLVALLAAFPDPLYWISLVENATVVVIDSKDNQPQPQPPSAEFLEALRKTIVADEISKRVWAGALSDHTPADAVMRKMDIARKFRNLCRDHGRKCGNWTFIAKGASTIPEAYHLVLKLGVLLVSNKPSETPPELDLYMEYMYTLDLDRRALFVASCHTVEPGLHFELGNIPANWRRIVMYPRDWLRVAYAYTPAVQQLLLARLGRDDVMSLVFDKMSGSLGSVRTCFQYVGALRELLFGEVKALDEDEQAPALRKMPDVLPLLLDVYSIPAPKYGPPQRRDMDRMLQELVRTGKRTSWSLIT